MRCEFRTSFNITFSLSKISFIFKYVVIHIYILQSDLFHSDSESVHDQSEHLPVRTAMKISIEHVNIFSVGLQAFLIGLKPKKSTHVKKEKIRSLNPKITLRVIKLNATGESIEHTKKKQKTKASKGKESA